MNKINLINHLYKDYIETCVKLKKEVDLKVLDNIYRHAESIINTKRQGSIFKIEHLENFSNILSKHRKEAVQSVIKDLLMSLREHNYKAELKYKIKPSIYKILVEVIFIENVF